MVEPSYVILTSIRCHIQPHDMWLYNHVVEAQRLCFLLPEVAGDFITIGGLVVEASWRKLRLRDTAGSKKSKSVFYDNIIFRKN